MIYGNEILGVEASQTLCNVWRFLNPVAYNQFCKKPQSQTGFLQLSTETPKHKTKNGGIFETNYPDPQGLNLKAETNGTAGDFLNQYGIWIAVGLITYLLIKK